MRKEIKAVWVERLRAKDTKITRGVLRNGRSNAMCPLGILCDIYIERNSKKAAWEKDEYNKSVAFFDKVNSTYESHLLPEIVEKWARLRVGKSIELKLKSGKVKYLQSLNDDSKLSRFVIADLIEAQL